MNMQNKTFRCFGDHPLYNDYHDFEWGVELRGDNAIFEHIVLEGFQSGLSWLTILKKRPAFREAFAGFDPHKVSKFTEADFERLMQNEGIVRNRRKIEATISNAKAVVALQANGKSLDKLVWSFAPRTHRPPKTRGDVPAITPESTALAQALKKNGFVFVGPTTMYAMMQSIGMVNDHLEGCLTLRV